MVHADILIIGLIRLSGGFWYCDLGDLAAVCVTEDEDLLLQGLVLLLEELDALGVYLFFFFFLCWVLHIFFSFLPTHLPLN